MKKLILAAAIFLPSFSEASIANAICDAALKGARKNVSTLLLKHSKIEEYGYKPSSPEYDFLIGIQDEAAKGLSSYLTILNNSDCLEQIQNYKEFTLQIEGHLQEKQPFISEGKK